MPAMLKDRNGRSLRPGERIIMQNGTRIVDGTSYRVATGTNSKGRPDLHEVIAAMRRMHQTPPFATIPEIANAYVPVTSRTRANGPESHAYLIPRYMVVKNMARENNAARTIQRRVRANNLIDGQNLAIVHATSGFPVDIRQTIGDEVARDRRRSARNPTGRRQDPHKAYEDARSVTMMGILSGKRNQSAGRISWIDPKADYTLPERARKAISSHMRTSSAPVSTNTRSIDTIGLAGAGYQRRTKVSRKRTKRRR